MQVKITEHFSSLANNIALFHMYCHFKVSQIAHFGWATSGPPALVAATNGPPVAHPPHRWRPIWGNYRLIIECIKIKSFLK